jgi:glycosyltransferase 2 family protein
MQWRGSAIVRLVLGLAVGVALLALVIAQVDLRAVAGVVVAASPAGIGLAVGIVLLDLLIRALRWQVLLRAASAGAPSQWRRAVAYLTIGYLANLLLPARLGDLGRAYLAGQAFNVSRLAALGTIIVERVADGLTMLALAVGASLLVAGVATVQTLALYGAALALAGIVTLVIGWWLLTRTRLAATRAGSMLRALAAKVSEGMAALRTQAGLSAVTLTTLGAAATATLVAWAVGGAVGLNLSPAEAALFLSAVALSLAIPAAPASLGTYELVGVIVLTSFGHTADQAFATILLMRAVTLLPPVLIGVVSVWILHLRPATIIEATE